MSAAVETRARDPLPRRDGGGGIARHEHTFTVLLFLLIVGALLSVLLMGAQSYRAAQAAGAGADEARLSTVLVANIIRSKDATASVRTEAGPAGGTVLVLTERLASGTFETRLYARDGALWEEYAPADTPLGTTQASELARTGRFDVEVGARSVTVTTDDGSVVVALRSADSVESNGGDAA